uniref:Uncharacterized protein n=1 Tax=Anopheles coluzzii TaxID=1518534 RepID=A0A6E8WDC2_ANOCL
MNEETLPNAPRRELLKEAALLAQVSSGKGRSTLHGHSYHLRLGLVVILRAFRMYQLDRAFTFVIAMEDPAGKDFDDIMYHYSSDRLSSGTVSIQAKHKQSNDDDGKQGVLTEDLLHARWDSKRKPSFSIAKYFISFLEVDQNLGTTTRSYVLCTNYVLHKSLKGQFIERQQQSDEDMLQFCYDVGATCYQINPEHENKTLEDQLINSALAKLGKMMANDVFHGKEIICKDSLYYTFAGLISKCVKRCDANATGFKFNEVYFNEAPNTHIGIFRTQFAEEYKGLMEDNELEISEIVKAAIIRIDQSSLTAALSKEESLEQLISKFYQSFMLVCQTPNEEELMSKAKDLLPKWCSAEQVFHNLHTLLFNAMKSTKPDPISLTSLQEKFREVDPNVNVTLLKCRSKEYLESMQQKYAFIKIDPDCLKRSKLNSFIASENSGGIYEFKCSLNLDVSSLIIGQTLSLHQYETLFIDSAMHQDKKELLNILDDLMSYLKDVNHPTIKLITFRGKLEAENLCEIKKLCESYHQKVVIVEQILDSVEHNFFPMDELTSEAKEQLFHDHENQIIFGTVTPLTSIIHEKDDLSFLLNVLEVLNQPEKMARYDSIEHNYEQIKPWYIHRQFVSLGTPPEKENITRNDNVTYSANPFEQQAEVPFADLAKYVLHNDKDTMSDIKKTLALSEETQDPPGCRDGENDGKVYIFLNEAGAGKTTYFTWLAWRLSTYDRSLYVIKLIALEYSTDFERLEECGVDHWNDTQIVRLLYRFIHLALFVPSVCRRTIEETDVHRAVADRCAELISLPNGRIVLDETKTKDLTAMQLIELRLFREKFNQNQLVLILDGFDEIAPYYKDVVMKCFAWFARFERIRSVYLSSRPYDFENDLKNAFQNCKMNRLMMLSRQNFIHFLHKYLLLNIEDYRCCEEDQRVNFLTILYVIITDVLKDSVSVPLLLDMVLLTLRPTIREHVNFKSCRASNRLLGIAKLDKLQLMEQFVARKLEIFNTDKSGTTNSSAKTAVAKKKEEQENKRIKQRHTLLAMYALFNSEDRAKLLSGREQAQAIELLEEAMQGEEKTGIISGVRDGIPQFVHRMFAEYFVACWLYQNMARFKQESVFKSQTIWAQPMKQVREFFNRMILQKNEGCDLHRAVVDGSYDLSQNIVKRKLSSLTVKDSVGRLALHVDSSNVIIYNDCFLKIIPCEIINQRDELFCWNALDYAFVCNNNIAIGNLLKCSVQLNVEILLDQLFSNDDTDTLIMQGITYAWSLQGCSKVEIADEILSRVVERLLNERMLDIYTARTKLNSLSVLEFCAKYNFDRFFHQLVTQVGAPLMQNMAAGLGVRLFQIAFEQTAHTFIKYLIEQCKLPLPSINDMRGLIDGVKKAIQNGDGELFKILFRQLCLQREIICTAENDLIDDIDKKVFEPFEVEIGLKNECCVYDSGNVKLTVPEYSFSDENVADYLIEVLVTTAVHVGNVPIVSYILQKTKTIVTNRLIVTVMRLFPKSQPLCHKKSIPAFRYLLHKTIDLRSVDVEGRNLFHMIAQNGCCYMLPCLMEKGFDPNEANPQNGWNGFHYLVSCLDEVGLRVPKTLVRLLPYHANSDWKTAGEDLFNFAINRSQWIVAQLLFQTHCQALSKSRKRSALLSLIKRMLRQHETEIVLKFLLFVWYNSSWNGLSEDGNWHNIYDSLLRRVPVV